MPTLQTLELKRTPEPTEDPVEPLGDLSSIQHLTAAWWQPSSDAAWLVGLKELTLVCTSVPDMELLRVLSVRANLEWLMIGGGDEVAAGDLPGAISPITLPCLKFLHLEFTSKESMARLVRILVTPQCSQGILCIEEALHLSRYVADYRRFVSWEERWAPAQYPESASIRIGGKDYGTHLEYEMEGRRVSFKVASEEEIPAFRDLVQKIQGSLKGPPVTVTIDLSSRLVWLFLKSLGDQNIRTIMADLQDAYGYSEPAYLLKAIGEDPDNLPGEPMTDTATDWPFKWLRSIEIHNALVKLDDFTRLVERYLPKNHKPLLEETALVNCKLQGMKLTQAAERLVVVGIALRGVECRR